MEALLEANLAIVDDELLNMQKQKSRPSVVIEEFVDGAGGNEDLSEEGSDEEGQPKDKKFGVKIHAQIEDVSRWLNKPYKFNVSNISFS
jgi:hypothetical protein